MELGKAGLESFMDNGQFLLYLKKKLNCPWTIFYLFTNLRKRRGNQGVLVGVKFNKKGF